MLAHFPDIAVLATLDAAAAQSFDQFVSTAPFQAYQQTRHWVAHVPRSPMHEYRFLLCRDGATLLATAVVRLTRLAPAVRLATMQRGPVVHDPAVLGRVLPAIKRALANAGCCTLLAGPAASGRALHFYADPLRDHGFVPLPHPRQPLHIATGIVRLDRGEEDILAGFKQRGRRQIRTAAKQGVTIREAVTPDDLHAYQTVATAFTARRRDYDMAGLPDISGQAALVASLGGALLIAERDGRTIGGHAFVRQGDEAIWLSLATLDDDAATPRSYPLLWEAMRRARAMGCTAFDLAGLPHGSAADPGEAGREQFKTAFAPDKRAILPMHVVALKAVAHAMFFNARQAYRSSAIRGSIGRLLGRRTGADRTLGDG